MFRDRVFAWHLELQNVHHRLEKALEDARKAIRSGLRAQALNGELLAFCYTFCSALGSHHRSEDAEFFPALLKRMPELEPEIARLRREHQILARLLAEFQRSLESPEATPQELFLQINNIKANMKAHFGYEEGALGRALHALDAPASAKGRMFGGFSSAGPDDAKA
ncbi:hemerythrin domain-containing protein [Spongiactinospora sp. TRM90649]|uniref:hemerythrin domain-containing protein n=1 Tax=Spongiactinospora sp. TRM90649 TaxID=3031114 RepID=UPI0023F82721|nr:hemerythrin domain-containing protein [Spongiactinospora sp. TRM90649]MDF5753043.1 hemerythrin domain-containing protein [Spongiactinospora sp. TRM90649]